jgi:hypothetical protein
VGLTTPHQKRIIVTKPSDAPRKDGVEAHCEGGKSPPRAVMPRKKKKKKIISILKLS